MIETNTTYVAQISLALPGKPDKATAIVTLAPADKLTVGATAKPLSECTLAELAAYGKALEAEVWDTYEAISLLELSEEGGIDIRVVALDEKGQAVDEVEDWAEHLIILKAATAPAEPPAKPSEPSPTTDAPATAETEAASAPAEASQPAEPAVDAPAVAVAVEPEAPAPPSTIIPSQARVRVAGGRLPLAESGGAAVDILLDESALRAMQAHALSSLDREVAGVMVGHRPEKQPDGRYVVHVIDSIVAKHTVMQGASVTYTPESWRYMNDTLWERYPDESAVMVGWYHTHPGFGIFLSGMDLFIHQNFFTQIWHVAYVLDPRARTSGFFSWNRQKTKVNRYDFLWPDWAAGSW
jgi:proteasome lid subunit RPN8/RPN11